MSDQGCGSSNTRYSKFLYSRPFRFALSTRRLSAPYSTTPLSKILNFLLHAFMEAAHVAVERNFSHARHILDTLRASMSDETFHKILFLYENRHLWVDVDPILIFGI